MFFVTDATILQCGFSGLFHLQTGFKSFLKRAAPSLNITMCYMHQMKRFIFINASITISSHSLGLIGVNCQPRAIYVKLVAFIIEDTFNQYRHFQLVSVIRDYLCFVDMMDPLSIDK